MKKLLEVLLRARIWYRWHLITQLRKEGLLLLEEGEPLSSERIIELSGKIDRHGMIAFRLEKELNEMVRPSMRR